MTVEIRCKRSTIVVVDRRPRQDITKRGNTTQVVSGDAPLEVIDRSSSVSIGSNLGRRGPRGNDGAGQIPAIHFSWGDAPHAVFTPSAAGVLVMSRLLIDTPFNGNGAAIRLGTIAAPECAIPAGYVDPYSEFEVDLTPDVPLAAGEALHLVIAPGTASQGAGRLFIAFV